MGDHYMEGTSEKCWCNTHDDDMHDNWQYCPKAQKVKHKWQKCKECRKISLKGAKDRHDLSCFWYFHADRVEASE